MATSWRKRALALFPAGSNGEYGIPQDMVPVLARGTGCRVWDTQGSEWLDMTMAWGSALVGHAHPKVLEAATDAARSGFNFAAVNRRSVELAERIAEISPCVEQIRFVASGTEATLLCLRVAHAATGRRKVLKFEGAYHGQHPVGEHRRIAGHLGREDLVGVQRVVVAGRARVLDDLGALQVLDEARGVDIAPRFPLDDRLKPRSSAPGPVPPTLTRSEGRTDTRGRTTSWGPGRDGACW